MIIYEKNDFCIRENTAEDGVGQAAQAHSHAFVELMFMLSGECELFVKDKLFALHRNGMILLPGGVRHRLLSCSSKSRSLTIAVPMSYIDLLLSSDVSDYLYNRALKLGSEELKTARAIYTDIVKECTQPDKYSEQVLKNRILDFFVYFLRRADRDETLEKEVTLIDEVAAYLMAHYNEEIGLKTVAQQFFVSRSYLSRLFKAKTGRGFNEYLNRIRIEQAKQQLLTTDLSVTDIAFACGFNDSNYFSRAFKKAEGVPPHSYRKQL